MTIKFVQQAMLAACASVLISHMAKAQSPGITLEATVLQGKLLDDAPVKASKSVLVADGTVLRFTATASYSALRYSVRSIEFSVSQRGNSLATYGPPGQPLGKKSKTRVVPFCSGKLTCAVLPMATVSADLGPVNVLAHAIGVIGERSISVSYFPVDIANGGSANPDNLPAASNPCSSNGVQIALRPSYLFNNDAKKLQFGSFYFSATYIGPNPGDPPCTGTPSGVSAKVGPAQIAPADDSLGDNAQIPGDVYVGNIRAVGKWHLVAYSPEVGVTVTCDRSFGNNGIVLLRAGAPDSVINGEPGMCL